MLSALAAHLEIESANSVTMAGVSAVKPTASLTGFIGFAVMMLAARILPHDLMNPRIRHGLV